MAHFGIFSLFCVCLPVNIIRRGFDMPETPPYFRLNQYAITFVLLGHR